MEEGACLLVSKIVDGKIDVGYSRKASGETCGNREKCWNIDYHF